jgi:hypothetical protein
MFPRQITVRSGTNQIMAACLWKETYVAAKAGKVAQAEQTKDGNAIIANPD